MCLQLLGLSQKTTYSVYMQLLIEFFYIHFFINSIPGKLKTFVQDLHSGKLHREFHHGPDPVTPESQTEPSQKPQPGVVINNQQQQQQKVKVPTDPPESTFKKLKPSEHRYSFNRNNRDEL